MTETEDTGEKTKMRWSCPLCTYNNAAAQLKCDLCSTPRVGGCSTSEAIQKQAKLLCVQWSCSICTFANIEGANKCAKCDFPRSSDPSVIRRKTVKPVDSVTSVTESSFCSDSPSSSDYKWKCSRCTYLNFPNAAKCTMCGGVAPKQSKLRPLLSTKQVRLPKEILKASSQENLSSKASFLVTGAMSRYVNYWTGRSLKEELFFKVLGSLIKGDPRCMELLVNYIVNDGNVYRSLNYLETLVLADFAPELSVKIGDTLLSLARRLGRADLTKMLDKTSVFADNLPCAAAGLTSELYCRIKHIFHFCRPPYNLPFRPQNFNVFKLPFPKSELAAALLNEMTDLQFDPTTGRTALKYVQVASSKTQEIRLCPIVSRPASLLLKTRPGPQSFFDAVLQAMFGVCDRYSMLRSQLYEHMASHADCYGPLYKLHCLAMASKVGVTVNNADYDDMWNSCLNACTDPGKPIEAIHLFALAHLIQRPVMVLPVSAASYCSKRPDNLLSLATSRSSPYHFLEGFYVPIYNKNDVVSRSPLCLVHDNGAFYSWITSDDFTTGVQNLVIVNFPRTQFASLFRFVDETEEKYARTFLSFAQLTPCSVAVRITGHDCLPEVTAYYYDYLQAAEKALTLQGHLRISDVLHQMSEHTVTSPAVSKMFSPNAKRLLSRRMPQYGDITDSSSGGESDDSIEDDEDETASKMAKVAERSAE